MPNTALLPTENTSRIASPPLQHHHPHPLISHQTNLHGFLGHQAKQDRKKETTCVQFILIGPFQDEGGEYIQVEPSITDWDQGA